MATKAELLNRGLVTSMDQALAPEGALTLAKNARYREGDPAVWQAEGRRTIGPTGDRGHGGPGPVVQMQAFEWDPGTSQDGAGTKPEPYQLIYISDGTVKSIPLGIDPYNTNSGSSLAQTYTLPTGAWPGQDPLTSAQAGNAHFLFSGRNNFEIRRSTTTQRLVRHGLSDATSDVTMYVGTTSGSGTVKEGYHFFWFTWYDSTNDIESGATVPSVLNSVYTYAAPWVSLWYQSADATSTDFRMYFQANNLEDKRKSADKVRIYKAPVETAIPSVENLILHPWPLGFRVAELDIDADIIANGYDAVSAVPGELGDTYHGDFSLASDNETYLENFPSFRKITVGGADVPLAGEPPNATTGALFGETLVTNDVNDPRKIRYSVPAEYHYFPAVYYMNFETEALDRVLNIKTLGNKLAVFLYNAIWRVNWLPQEADFNFNRGQIRDSVSQVVGTLGPKSVCEIDWPGKGVALATVHKTGIYVTDLYSIKRITENFDWKALQGKLNTKTTLINNNDEKRLELYLDDEAWYFHYDESHIDEQNNLAITGPIERPAGIGTACAARTPNNTHRTITSDTGSGLNNIYYEGMGYTDEGNQDSSGTPLPLSWEVATREIYPWGPGGEGQTRELMVHMKPSGVGGGTWNAEMQVFRGPTGEIKQAGTITSTTRTLRLETVRNLFESYLIRFVGTTTSESAAMAVNFIAVEYESLDGTERGT